VEKKTSAIGGLVWVALPLILDGTGHASALAAVAGGGGAINKLLLREVASEVA
jgi:hypothetical protein